MLNPRLYLDHAATTPMLPAAREAMADALGRWANPSSPHREGRAARAALEEARARIVAALGWQGALIFTSGASEALAIALGRAKAGERRISTVEHDAVRRVAKDAAPVPVGADGLILLGDVPAGALVAVQAVNNETGVIQPLEAIAGAVRAAGGLLLADCAQSAGKLPLPDADFIAVSAHKLGGPPGIGALLVRDLATLTPSGGQEQGYRAGTENLPAAIGFAAALEARGARDHMAALRDRLDAVIRAGGGMVVADGSPRLAEIGSYRMPGVPAAAQLIQFDAAGIAVSAGSACSSGSLKPSHVLAAMGWDEMAAREVVRVSFGANTDMTAVDRFVAEWTRMADRARARAA
ncbi:aminotransferase [Sphingomonas oleivorans]|uniref:Cysteine desulfurase n=1 Tax=Sphingomonas oleivorans TaxID=1735121 RepID=A0A2T5FTG6_9SPHN|nr:aminotransferase class V-fold PLP-dependent enzyme [Sphingomonas oleivorans]PTQ07356.1 aminotransferase [Sphingomonas oleivorans]